MPLDNVRGGKLTWVSRVAVLDLEGGVTYAEMLLQFLTSAVQKGIVAASFRSNQVRGQSHFSRAQRPDVKVMDFLHAG